MRKSTLFSAVKGLIAYSGLESLSTSRSKDAFDWDASWALPKCRPRMDKWIVTLCDSSLFTAVKCGHLEQYENLLIFSKFWQCVIQVSSSMTLPLAAAYNLQSCPVHVSHRTVRRLQTLHSVPYLFPQAFLTGPLKCICTKFYIKLFTSSCFVFLIHVVLLPTSN